MSERRLVSVARAASALAFLLLAAVQVGKPLNLDAMEFPAMAGSLLESGSPAFYRGERLGVEVSYPFHPPLYLYSLTAFMALFGPGAATARMFGALATLVQAAVTLALGRALVGRRRMRRAAMFFWPLFLLQPYTLQSAANPDIDTTIYGPLLGLVLLAAVRLGRRDGREREDDPAGWEFLLPGALLVVALWAKATTALPVAIALFLFLPATWPRLGRAVFTLLTAVAAFAIFAAGFAFWSQTAGLDLGISVSMLWTTLLGGATGAAPVAANPLAAAATRAVEMLPFTVRWIGALPLLVAAAALVRPRLAAGDPRDPEALRLLRWLAALALALHLGYCSITGSFGAAPFKYVAPVWAWLVLLLALVVADAAGAAFDALTSSARRRTLSILAAFGAGCLLVGRFALRDSVVLHGATTGENLYPQAWSIWLPALAVVPWLLFAGRDRRRMRPAAVLALLAATAFAGLAAGVAVLQARVPYSTTYNYGQDGLADAAAYLRLHTSPDETIVAMKDLGWRARRRYWDSFAATAGDPAATADLIARLAGGDVRYAVFTDSRGQDGLDSNQEIGSWMRAHGHLVAKFGNYLIYELPAASRNGVTRTR